jgi:hypothetical protein
MSVFAEAFDNQAPFLGHPFGGAARDDDFSALASAGHLMADGQQTSSSAQPSSDDEGNFDFHLGVYARF